MAFLRCKKYFKSENKIYITKIRFNLFLKNYLKKNRFVIQCVYIKRMQDSGGGIIFILSVERLCRIVKKRL